MSVLDLARPEVLALTPYSSARMEATAAAVMLNANESPWPPDDPAGPALNRYPEPQPRELCTRLGALHGLDASCVLVGRGSDEAIDLLTRAFCRPRRDAILVCPPTFGMYAVCAGIQGADVVNVPLTGTFELDVDAVSTVCTPRVKLLFVCSPNNPTGGTVPLNAIEQLSRALAGRALVIVDEAYGEFADVDSATTLLSHHANLGVLRTLSKAWALAGARVGALLANPDVIALLRRIMPPYPLPTPSVHAAMQVLDEAGIARMHARVAVIVRERERMRAALQSLPGVRSVLASAANFLTVRLHDAAAAHQALLAHGIVVRDVSRCPGLKDCLRISIGTPNENARLLEILAGQRVMA